MVAGIWGYIIQIFYILAGATLLSVAYGFFVEQRPIGMGPGVAAREEDLVA